MNWFAFALCERPLQDDQPAEDEEEESRRATTISDWDKELLKDLTMRKLFDVIMVSCHANLSWSLLSFVLAV